jgi:4'-phosphopantetheinyl transferase
VPGTVEVWRVAAPEGRDLAHLAPLLDADERERLDRYRQEADRRRHLAAHGGLRLLLGRRLGIPPGQVVLGRADCPLCGGPHGRPVVVGVEGAPEVSVAHAEAMVLLALASAPVGVDVEPASRTAVAGELTATLHPTEAELVAALPAGRRDAAVLACFVRAEAHLKGLGTGLGLDPATVALGPAAPDVARAGPGWLDRLGVPGWDVLDLDLGPAHVAALALTGSDRGTPVPAVRDLDLSLP